MMQVCDICRFQDVPHIAIQDFGGLDFCNTHMAQLGKVRLFAFSLMSTLKPGEAISDLRCREIAEKFRPLPTTPFTGLLPADGEGE